MYKTLWTEKFSVVFLKELVLWMEWTLWGNWFHASKASTRKARSPNNSLVHGMNRLFVSCRPQNWMAWRHGDNRLRRSLTCAGAFLARAWCTSRHSLYWMRASAGSQWSSVTAGVTWSCHHRPLTSLTAVLMMRWYGETDEWGSWVSSTLPSVISDNGLFSRCKSSQWCWGSKPHNSVLFAFSWSRLEPQKSPTCIS